MVSEWLFPFFIHQMRLLCTYRVFFRQRMYIHRWTCHVSTKMKANKLCMAFSIQFLPPLMSLRELPYSLAGYGRGALLLTLLCNDTFRQSNVNCKISAPVGPRLSPRTQGGGFELRYWPRHHAATIQSQKLLAYVFISKSLRHT